MGDPRIHPNLLPARGVIEQRIRLCEQDIRKAALELIEEALPFAQHPELQEFSQQQVKRLYVLLNDLATSVDSLRENNDELDQV